MQISAQKVVGITYTLKDDAGEVLDTSVEGDPLTYIHGIGGLVPGLEKALEGKANGDHLTVVVAAADGYGARDDSLVRKVPVRKLPEGKARVGARVRVDTENGPMFLLILGVQGDYATVDPNHPLAGETLHFEVDVVEVRDATEDELKHGHVHRPGQHHHH